MTTTVKATPKKRISIVDIQLVRKGSLLSPNRKIDSPSVLAEVVRELVGDPDREHMIVIGANTKLEPVLIQTVHIGSLNAMYTHPREIFKSAILSNCSAIFLAHCHPSGHVSPSQEDIDMTKRMKHAGDILGIDVQDHIIFTNDQHFSIRDKVLAYDWDNI